MENTMIWDFVWRLVLAALFGTIIGLDREYREKEAGFRTHFLVSLGSALMMIVSQYGFSEILTHDGVSLDPSRIAAQVVSGIGFIGAGTIIFNHQIFAAEGAFGQYLVCFRELPVAIGITAGAREYLAADICLKYMKEAVSIPCPEEKREEGEKYLEAKIKSLSLPQPEGRLKTAEKELSGLFNREIIFTENPRNIESAKIIPEGCKLRLEMIVQGEKKIAYAGFKSWKQNDLYPDDFTKRYHSIAYGMDQETLYLSVGLLNTSYREEYSFWVNSKDTVIATWRPNVTYLPEQPDMVWKFTGNFKS